MSKNSIIAIGGTGAKCLEAITFLSAAGLDYFNSQVLNNKIFTILVDPDQANGNVVRTKRALTNYNQLRSIVNNNGKENLLKIQIEYFNNQPTWSPVANGLQDLNGVFVSNALGDYKNIYDVLFTGNEQVQDLTEGFRGHPSLGAPVISENMDFDTGVWNSLKTTIQSELSGGNEFRVLLIGSIFGGTGAAGFPVIARKLKDLFPNTPNFKLGGILLLPYFGFESIAQDLDERSRENRELISKSNEFLFSSKIALQFYYNQQFGDIFDHMYIIGDNNIKNEKYCKGRQDQENDANVLEIYAALSAKDFFKKDNFDDDNKVSLIGREYRSFINWKDFPGGSSGDFKKATCRFAKFSAFYLAIIYPYLLDMLGKKNKSTIPWYYDYFKSINDYREADGKLIYVKTFCEKYLKWLEQIQNHPGYNFALFNNDSLNIYPKDINNGFKKANRHFNKMINQLKITGDKGNLNTFNPKITGDSRSISLRNIWDAISVRDNKYIREDIFVGFFNKLYLACE
jgi:hypothetical protein